MSDHSNSEIPNGLYYVDVAVLAKIFAKRYGTSVNAAYEWFTKDVEVPLADVQPVVRCKDCVYWSSKKTRYCNMLKGTFQENDYCSYAERRTDE